jgi:RNA polymerase sigma factor (sigma-70 family)
LPASRRAGSRPGRAGAALAVRLHVGGITAFRTPALLGSDPVWRVAAADRQHWRCPAAERERDADVAHLDVDAEAVTEALVAASAYRSTSLFAPVGTDDGPTLADRLGVEEPDYEAVTIHETLRPLLASLPERERHLITMRLFGNMTQTHIAERLGISQMQVSRLLTRTLSRLRREMLATG